MSNLKTKPVEVRLTLADGTTLSAQGEGEIKFGSVELIDGTADGSLGEKADLMREKLSMKVNTSRLEMTLSAVNFAGMDPYDMLRRELYALRGKWHRVANLAEKWADRYEKEGDSLGAIRCLNRALWHRRLAEQLKGITPHAKKSK